MGTKHVRTTPYHPCANGLIERWHRTLKAALMCHKGSWIDTLPTVLLGLRCSYKEDIKATPAELVYGTSIRLPGEFLAESTSAIPIQTETYVENLRNIMQSIRSVQTSAHAERKCFVHDELKKCTKVFVRNDAVTPPLQAPYDGPYEVLSRTSKVYKLAVNGKTKTISIDRLKPTFEATEATDEGTSNATTVIAARRKISTKTPPHTAS